LEGAQALPLGEERDEDMLTEMDSVSASGYMGGDPDTMDEDLDNLTSRSVGGYEDRISDDGSASLVGFGEGAGSTLSGPIYHRRPLPSQGAAALWGGGGLERSSSGLSEGMTTSPNPHHGGSSSSGRRDFAVRPVERETGADTPVSQSAVRERREARMMDGVALDSAAPAAATLPTPDDDVFVDTTTRGPVPVQQPTTANTIRDRQQQQQSHPHPHPHPHQHHRQHATTHQQHATASSREAAERIVRERLDEGEGRVGSTALGSPQGRERLGKFYFEDR
jgi:hypothetical protein